MKNPHRSIKIGDRDKCIYEISEWNFGICYCGKHFEWSPELYGDVHCPYCDKLYIRDYASYNVKGNGLVTKST